MWQYHILAEHCVHTSVAAGSELLGATAPYTAVATKKKGKNN
jgi:hypothetical protein